MSVSPEDGTAVTSPGTFPYGLPGPVCKPV